MEKKDKDLCLTCEHYWEDYPAPLQDGVPHCDKVDEKYGLWDMDLFITYPCLKCPFNCYSQAIDKPYEKPARQA